MAKRKTVPDTEAVHRYLSSLEESYDTETSELKKALLFYEMQAKATLIGAGYMTERGKWVKGYNADVLAGSNRYGLFDDLAYDKYFSEDEKLKRIAQKAVRTLFYVRRCRKNASLGNLEKAVLDMENIVYYSNAVRQKRSSEKGGGADKRNKGLVEAVEKVRSSLKGKATAGTILRQFRTKYNAPENAIATDSGFKVYLAFDEETNNERQERFFIKNGSSPN